MIRVLAPFPPPYGGVAIHCVRLVEGLRALGLSVHAISLGGIPDAFPGVVRLGVGFFLSRKLVHYHTDQGNHRWMRLMSLWWRLTRTPYIVTVHSFRQHPDIERARVQRGLARAFQKANAIIAISKETAADLEKHLDTSFPKMRIVPSDLPTSAWERACPLPLGVPQRWSNAPIRLLANAGRVVRFRGKDLYGIDVLLRAFALVQHPHASLCIAVGAVVDGTLWSELQTLIEQDSRVVIVQNITTPLLPLVVHAHAVVRPTRTEGGSSLSLQEALECGRWAVGSDAVPRPEGTVVFRNEDEADCARVIATVISDVERGHMPPARPINPAAVQQIANVYSRYNV